MQNEQNSDYNDKMIAAFIAKPEKESWYRDSFSKFNINGVDTLKWNWSWWAFSGGFLYLLYRKQYIPSLLLFIVSVATGEIPLASLILMILAGGYSTYFVYKGYKSKLLEIEASVNEEDKRIEAMQNVGGYNQWVVWVYIVIAIIVVITFISILSTFPSKNFL